MHLLYSSTIVIIYPRRFFTLEDLPYYILYTNIID